MKKTRILLIGALIIVVAGILLAGCSKKDKISSIELKGNSPDTPIETQIGRFDYEDYVLLVNYESGTVEELALTEDMVSELDQLKFYQAGEHVITVSYGGKTCEFKISVKRDVFGELKFPENNVFTYDGTEHTVEIEGELPSNATVSYIGGNTFINAGEYNVTAVIACNGYVTKKVSTTVTIEKAKYDVGNIKFEPKEFVYDGKEHSVEISGELPAGVSAPVYYINGNNVSGVTDADEYVVTAVFPNTDSNYESIPNMVTTLKIHPAEYDLGKIDLVYKNEDGSALYGPWKVYDGSSVVIDIENGAEIKKKVSVSYTITDEDGNEISRSQTKTNIINAGDYTIKLDFVLLDSKNYKPIAPMEFNFTVNKAKYDTTRLKLLPEIVEYDGNSHSLRLVVPTNWDTTNIDVAYEYYLAGSNEIIKENGENAVGVRDAGEYVVRAVFTVKDPNYDQIPYIEERLIIDKKRLSVSQFVFDDTSLVYTGNALTPTFDFKLESYLDVSEISVFKLQGDEYIGVDAAVDAGVYRYEVTIGVADVKNYVFDNGDTEIKIACDFEIEKAEISVFGIGFDDDNVTFVQKGETLTLEFVTNKVDGLKFEAFYCKVNGSELLDIEEAKAVTPDDLGVIKLTLDTSELNAGIYICAVNVMVESQNFMLVGGDELAQYYFEFMIEG